MERERQLNFGGICRNKNRRMVKGREERRISKEFEPSQTFSTKRHVRFRVG